MGREVSPDTKISETVTFVSGVDSEMQVFVDAVDALAVRWKSEACPVCSETKWPNSPWCRSCSIRVHRAGLFKFWKRFTHRSTKVIVRYKLLADWARWYDYCTDFLVSNSK